MSVFLFHLHPSRTDPNSTALCSAAVCFMTISECGRAHVTLDFGWQTCPSLSLWHTHALHDQSLQTCHFMWVRLFCKKKNTSRMCCASTEPAARCVAGDGDEAATRARICVRPCMSALMSSAHRCCSGLHKERCVVSPVLSFLSHNKSQRPDKVVGRDSVVVIHY